MTKEITPQKLPFSMKAKNNTMDHLDTKIISLIILKRLTVTMLIDIIPW